MSLAFAKRFKLSEGAGAPRELAEPGPGERGRDVCQQVQELQVAAQHHSQKRHGSVRSFGVRLDVTMPLRMLRGSSGSARMPLRASVRPMVVQRLN